MATQKPLLPPGQFVQYNVQTQSPRSLLPTPEEQTIGVVRQAFTQSDGPYYQVVWAPGSDRPKTALYHESQLCPLNQDQANQILDQMAAGTYKPNLGTPSQLYQQPNIPLPAAPPAYQQPGMETL